MQKTKLLGTFAASGLIILIGSASGCAVLGSASPVAPFERMLLFHPVRYPRGDWEADGLPIEDTWFQADDGTQLHGWFLGHPDPSGVALFIHGNGGNITSHKRTLRMLNQGQRLAVLAFDYRGYGRSEGKPSEQGILQDARAARRQLAARTGVAEDEIVLVGFSLGGGVAVDLAALDGARALVLMSTFTSLPDVAANHLPWTSPHVNMTQGLNSLAKIKRYRGPLLISHGTLDRVIPYEHAVELFEAAYGPKKLVPLEGGGHTDPDSDEYQAALREFIRALPPIPDTRRWEAGPHPIKGGVI